MKNYTECTLTDKQLIEKSFEWVSKLAESGGRKWTLKVPADVNGDPDLLFAELGNRLKKYSPEFVPTEGDRSAEENAVTFILDIQDYLFVYMFNNNLKALRKKHLTDAAKYVFNRMEKKISELSTATRLLAEIDSAIQKQIDKNIKTPQEILSPLRGKGNYHNCVDYDDAIKAMEEYAALRSKPKDSGQWEEKITYTDDEHLLPCPFCGGKPEWVHKVHPSGVPGLQCNTCQFLMKQDRRDKTISHWNNRVQPSFLPAGEGVDMDDDWLENKISELIESVDVDSEGLINRNKLTTQLFDIALRYAKKAISGFSASSSGKGYSEKDMLIACYKAFNHMIGFLPYDTTSFEEWKREWLDEWLKSLPATGEGGYSKQQVINIIDELLQRPDLLIDAVNNENTDYGAESLFDIAISV